MPWDPMRDLLTMHERLDSLFGRATPGWVPTVDLYETADQYVLTAELPGLARQDIQLEFRDDALVLHGTRTLTGGADKFQQLERGQGHFSRVFRFAHAVQADAIAADLTDGVLTVTIPKTATSGQRIEVQ